MKIAIEILMPILVLLSIAIEFKKYGYLKKKIEEKLPTSNPKRNKNKESEYLINSYRLLQKGDIQAFRSARINLKILKEKQSDGGPFEDITKLITVVISLISVMVTLTLNIFKDEVDLATDFFTPAMDIIWILLWVIGWMAVLSRIFAFSTNRSTELINIHLIVIDEVAKDPELGIDKSSETKKNSNQKKR